MRSLSPSSESGRRRRTYQDDRPVASSSSRPPLPQRSPSPTTSNRPSSAGAYSRRPAWDADGPQGGALPSRPDFSPNQRRFSQRPDRERPGDRDPSGQTRPFHERDRDTISSRPRDRERDRDGPGPSGGRDSWLAPGPPGKARAADDGWASRRRPPGGQDRIRDRSGREQREQRPPNGRRPSYDRDGPGPRMADYPDRGPPRPPPPHLTAGSLSDMDAPANPGWQRRPPNASRAGHDPSRPNTYANNPPRARNPSGTSQPYPPRGGAGPSNYSRAPPPSSMVDPSLWRTSYNPPPPSDRYPSLEYDEPPHPSGSAGPNSGSDGRVADKETDRADRGVRPISTAYVGDDEPEEGEELEEGEVQSEDGEVRDAGADDKDDGSSTGEVTIKVEPEPEVAPTLPRPTSKSAPFTPQTQERPAEVAAAVSPHSPRTPPSPSLPPLPTSAPDASLRATSSPPKQPVDRLVLDRPHTSPPPSLPVADANVKVESSILLASPPAKPSTLPSAPGPSQARDVSPSALLSAKSPSLLTSEPVTVRPATPTSGSGSSPNPKRAESPALPQVARAATPTAGPAPVAAASAIASTELSIWPTVADVEMSSPLTPMVAVGPVSTAALVVDERVSKDADQEVATADVSMEDVAPLGIEDVDSGPAEEDADDEPVQSVQAAEAEEIFPLTEEEIADVVVVRAQARVSNDPYTAFLREQNIASLYHFNEQLSDEPSSRIPLNPPSSPDSNADDLPLPLTPLANVARLAVAIRVRTLEDEDADKIDRLRNEYRVINAEWQATCQRLDRLTEKRNAAKAQRNGGSGFGYGFGNGGAPRTPSTSTASGGAPVLGMSGPGAIGAISGGGGGLLSSVHTPSGSAPSLLLYEESRPSRASRSRASNQDANNGYFADAVRSEAEFQSILASLEDADARDPNLRAARTTAVVPDMILRTLDRVEDTYDDESGLVLDPVDFYEDNVVLHGWTDEERAVFEKRFARDPKQFGKISDYLPHKSTQDCVLFYYRTKKTVDFRSIVAQKGGSRRKGGRRGGTKNSALLSNLVRKRPKADDTPANANSGSATPRYEDDDMSGPATPSFSGSGKKRSRTEGGGGDDGSLASFGAQAKKSRMFELAADGGANPGRMASALLNGSTRPASAQNADTDDLLLALATDGHVAPPNPSSARLAAIEAGEMTPAPKRKASRKKKVPVPTAPGEGSVAPDAIGAAEFAALEPGRKDSADSQASASVGADGKERRRKPNPSSSYWTGAERAAFMAGLGQHGKDWALVSQSMQGVKTAVQVKNFFQTNNEALGLSAIAEAATGEARKITPFDSFRPLEKTSLFNPTPDNPSLPSNASLAPPPASQGSRAFASSASPSLSTGSVEPPRPRSGMNIHDLLNSPDKPAVTSSTSAAVAALRPPVRQPLNEPASLGRPPDSGDVNDYPGSQHRPSWASPAAHAYPSASSQHDPHPDARPHPSSFAYDSEPRPSYSLPPPPHHYPPIQHQPSHHHDQRPYSSYAAPASHPTSSSSARHPYGDYPHGLPLPSRPYSASGSPGSWPGGPPPPPHQYQRSPSGEHPPYGYPAPPPHHQQQQQQQHYARGGYGGEGESQYHHHPQGGSPRQEYRSGGGHPEERDRVGGAGPPSWAGQPNRRVS